MNYQVVSVPSIQSKNGQETLFDHFLTEYEDRYADELLSIVDRLEIIGNKTGAREHFFKDHEGTLGDGVCALFDTPNRNLRLYCIKYGSACLIIGGGGNKQVRTLQEDPKLKYENYLLRSISKAITQTIKDRGIRFSNEGEFIGNLHVEIEIP